MPIRFNITLKSQMLTCSIYFSEIQTILTISQCLPLQTEQAPKLTCSISQHWPWESCVVVVDWTTFNVSMLVSHGSGLSHNPGWVHCYCISNYYILATSVVVECVFSHGCILLSHICNCLSVQTTCTLLCLSVWSLLGLVKDSDVDAVPVLPDVPEGGEMRSWITRWIWRRVGCCGNKYVLRHVFLVRVPNLLHIVAAISILCCIVYVHCVEKYAMFSEFVTVAIM